MQLAGIAWVAGLSLGVFSVLSSCATYDPLEAARGCEAYALGTCQTYARCSATLIAPYGSVEGCQLQLASGCTYGLSQPDVLGTGAGAEACGQLMAALDCNALWNNELPAGCLPAAGRRGNGAPCSVGAQCASTRCEKGPSATGTCEEPALLGEACAGYGDCGGGLFCSSELRCVALAQAGQACSDGLPCHAPLFCLNGACASELPLAPVAPVEVRDPRVECQGFAQALCARYEACSTSLLAGSYGSLAACVARSSATCVDNLALPDTAATALGVSGCAAALSGVSCNALLENSLPEACRLVSGVRSDGARCVADAQCVSMRCARVTTTRCGTCAARAQLEQACVSASDCEYGLVCASDGKCRAPLPQGASCDTTKPCAWPLVCASSACQAPLPVGASCDVMADACNAYAGVSCDYRTLQCVAWTSSATGQACGYTAQGLAACTGSGACKLLDTWQGQCQAPIADAAACQSGGPACQVPAACRDGVCVLGSGGDCL